MDDAQKKAPDWERIESDYRAGLLSLREIAGKDGNVSEGAIRKRAKRDGWSRDVAEKIKARADDLVRKAEVRSEVRSESGVQERVLIEANAEAIANIRMAHRGDIRRSRDLAMALLSELENETGGLDLFEQLGDMLLSPDDKGVDKLNELYRKVISLPSRVDSTKKLAETLKHLIGLEREAYGIEEVQKVELTGKDGAPLMPNRAMDMTDEQLAAIAAGGSAGITAASSGKK